MKPLWPDDIEPIAALRSIRRMTKNETYSFADRLEQIRGIAGRALSAAAPADPLTALEAVSRHYANAATLIRDGFGVCPNCGEVYGHAEEAADCCPSEPGSSGRAAGEAVDTRSALVDSAPAPATNSAPRPCPFCGSADIEFDTVVIGYDYSESSMRCTNCGARGPTASNDDNRRRESIVGRDWNIRAAIAKATGGEA